MAKCQETTTTTSNDDGVCDKIYSVMCSPCSVFSKHHRHEHEIPITSGSSTTTATTNSVINPPPPPPPPPPRDAPPPPTAAEISGGGMKKDDVDDGGFSGYIDRAKAKIRASSTFKVEEKKGTNNNYGMGRGKRVDSLNYKVNSYIKRTKLKMMRAPSTLDGSGN